MIEYFISALSDKHFKVAKFSGNEQPENIYYLVMRVKGERGHTGASDPEFHCDCPNRRRSKHVNDKHGQMVAKWLLLDRPQGAFNESGEFTGLNAKRAYNETDTDDGDPDGLEEGEHD